MALKSFFSNLFGQSRRDRRLAQMLNDTPVFSQFGDSIYASDIVQICIDVIATECSKLLPRHIRTDPETNMQTNVKGSINRLFRIAPNELMTTRDFIEKVIWLLYLNYNCFIYPTYEINMDKSGKTVKNYTGFYPLNPKQVDFEQDETGTLFVRLYFQNGQEFQLPYSEVIHLRKKFSTSDIMGGGMNGQPDNAALLKVLEINDTVLQGLGKAVKTSLSVRGIIKINTMLDDDAQKAERARFEAMIQTGEAGILPLDVKGEYTPISVDPKLIDRDTMQFLQDKILNWYGVSIPIFTGKFTDEEYQAFYEKVLEPLVISMGQAFSKTLFTAREIDVGNELVFYPQKLLFTNTKNRIAVADILGNRGALRNNDLLDLFGYPPYEGGNTRYMSLNFVDVDIANEYQLTRAKIPQISEPIPAAGGKTE